MLAQVHFFRRDIPAFRTAAEKAMSLNPRDTDTLAMMGLMLVHIAEFERGAKSCGAQWTSIPIMLVVPLRHHLGAFAVKVITRKHSRGSPA
jgi:hypothetical protein